MTRMETLDVIVIGAGLSGLAAGIRLSQYGHRVRLFERHAVPGGLNSYYVRHGRLYDTGLHALTNVGAPGDRAAPLNLLCRQLRLRRDEWDIRPQRRSAVALPSATLQFDNDIATLQDSVATAFPHEADAFARLVAELRAMDPFVNGREFRPLRPWLAERVRTPLLRALLCCPVMYYGNATAGDMDLRQFCILFRSMFLEGMGRPAGGMRTILDQLCRRLEENGAELHLRRGVAALANRDGAVTEAIADDGEAVRADVVLSCCGGPETGRLLSPAVPGLSGLEPGEMSYVEAVFDLACPPAELGLSHAVLFRHGSDTFDYRPEPTTLSPDSLVVCVPANFDGMADASREVRVTALGGCHAWNALAPDAYRAEKERVLTELAERLEACHPGFAAAVTTRELYTPRTFTRFTGRLNGAIYGMPHKWWDGRTPLRNLRLVGADQGYLGIVGAMLSGVTVANDILRG